MNHKKEIYNMITILSLMIVGLVFAAINAVLWNWWWLIPDSAACVLLYRVVDSITKSNND